MTRTKRSKLFSPTAGLALLWAVIRFFLLSYAAVFGSKAQLGNKPGFGSKPAKSVAREQ